MDIVLVCIGTDKCIGDSLGPLVGTDLDKWVRKTKKDNVYVYGTLKDCVTAKNLQTTIKYIDEKHENPFIIAIDACVHKDIGNISMKNEPIQPGSGVNKKLDKIGDMSIVGYVTDNPYCLFGNSIKLNLVVELKEEIVKRLKRVVNKKLKTIK